jgi:hypothetical protein
MERSTAAKTDTVKRGPVYIVGDGEMLIDAPVKSVWPHVLSYPKWQDYSIVRHVSGKPGAEGEVVFLQKESGGVKSVPYFARTIKLDPERRVIWKTFRENVEYFGIVEFRVEPVDGKTRFSYNVLYETVVPYEDESELETRSREGSESLTAYLAIVLPKLKTLAEQGG